MKPAKKAAVVIENPTDEKSGEAKGDQRLEASVCMTQQAEGASGMTDGQERYNLALEKVAWFWQMDRGYLSSKAPMTIV